MTETYKGHLIEVERTHKGDYLFLVDCRRIGANSSGCRSLTIALAHARNYVDDHYTTTAR